MLYLKFMCDLELANLFDTLILEDKSEASMNSNELTAIVTAAISAALKSQKEDFDKKIEQITKKFATALPGNVEPFEEVRIVGNVQCDETLDLVKSLPEFNGKQEDYVSWRQAAHTAYKLYERYEGSAKHYQAVALIRNKIRGPADNVLASFNTVLNFKAIIARLDFTYADKRPIYLIEQELSTLRQGNLTIIQFYDEVERKLTLLTNKTIMTYEGNLAISINEKYRTDALRVFISGLRKPLCDILFSTRPTDLPSALALAQELEANHERYTFATLFSKRFDDNSRSQPSDRRSLENNNGQLEYWNTHKNPHFQHNYNRQQKRSFTQNGTQKGPEPMEIDPSTSRFRRPSNFELKNSPNGTLDQTKANNFQGSRQRQFPQNTGNLGQQTKRRSDFERSTGPKMQRINHITQDRAGKISYDDLVKSEVEDIEEEIHFLGERSLLPWVSRTIGDEKRIIKMLIDTGASKSYIRPFKVLKGIVPLAKPFLVKSIHGETKVSEKCKVHLFGINSDFVILPTLINFDAIIGLDLLTQVNAIVDLKKGIVTHDFGIEKLLFTECENINIIQIKHESVPLAVKDEFLKMIRKRSNAFADPNESLPYNTNIVATIRTKHEEPIYSKLYPYPLGVADFVENEIKELLHNGIIRPSRSPYNNPIWVVDKKGFDELGNRKKRLVVDFRKINEVTIDDKYPIPNVTSILSNMGQSQYFSTLDLKSGFHQIELAERDREKTAFSVSNGKYEFCRLPFGLKNAPSIFQRAIDDVLRERIGKSCYVYVDDVIIFSQTKEKHVEDVNWVLKSLYDANMRVSVEKSQFFKNEIEYLGFIVSRGGIKTCPDKVHTMLNFPAPENLYSLRSFLGLASYYRCFIKDFASIAKPLTDILKGENGKVSANRSKKVKITLDSMQYQAFDTLKRILISEDVMLAYPDFKKHFDLTTDASNHGLGAVLSQDGRPITMISRTLKGNELNFATNERELLAIVWALKNLRNYLYGVKHLNIFTDHQPLTFAVSDRNSNAKLKRWRAFIDEHNAKLHYKPGKENNVADALSRQQVNLVEQDTNSDCATIHSERSLTYTIQAVEKPINCFKNQIIIEEAENPSKRTFIVFGNRARHLIQFRDKNTLLGTIQDLVNTNVVNAIHCSLPILAHIQHDLVQLFPNTKFKYAEKFVTDIFDQNDQMEIIITEHNRAHRAAQENVKQILNDYFFPKLEKKAKEAVGNCKICSKSKYNRHHQRHKIAETPIPSYLGEILHIDVFSTDSKFFLTCLDKFSKFAVVQTVQSRTIVDIKPQLMQLLNIFPNAKTIYCDNEKSFNSNTVRYLLANSFGIEIVNAPPLHSASNGQVERFHSTLIEIARCIKLERSIEDTRDLILLATIEYNKTIHSVTNKRPIDIFRPMTENTNISTEIPARLKHAQQLELNTHNKNRMERKFHTGDKVLVKRNTRLGNKLTPLYDEQIIEKDLGTTVLIKGRVVHKDNLK